MIRRAVLSAFVLSFVAVTALVGAATSSAAPAVGGQHCLVPKAGEQARCAATEAELEEMSATATTAIVTVYVKRNYNPDGGWITWYREPCSGPVGDLDYSFGLSPYNKEISSVKKYADGHCNWQLEGPAGNRSTWVEGSWANLNNLGNGWEDRAVKIRLT